MKVNSMNVETGSPGLIAVNRWAAQLGRKPITIWRWERQGKLKLLNISGRKYIANSEIERFTERAAKGEFAQDHPTPKRVHAD
jgi:hypothetical protein